MSTGRSRTAGPGAARWSAALGLAAILGCAPPAADGQADGTVPPLAAWVVGEAARLDAVAAGLGAEGPALATALAEVRSEAAAGRPLWAAWRLIALRADADGRAFVVARRAAVATPEALDREAAARGVELNRLRERYDAAPPPAPAAVAAFADTCRNQAPVYQSSAAAYGRASSPPDGLYYLGQSASLMRTALELQALAAPAPVAPAPAAHDLDGELAAVDSRTLAAYGRPGAETGQHRGFIVLNARLKEGRELLAARRPAAAELATLDALRRVAQLEAAGAAPEAASLRAAAATWRRRLDAVAWDASVGRFFLEMAESALAAETPSTDDLERARAALETALPRFLELREER